MHTRTSFLVKAAFLSVLVLGTIFFTVSPSAEPGSFIPKAVFYYLMILVIALFWAIAIFNRSLSKMAADVLAKYDNIEQILLDLRDGTKHFYREKRRVFRVKTDMIARFTGKTGDDDFAKIVDISYDGALLKTTQPLRSGDAAKLDIYLPLFPEPIHVKAIVKRATPTKELRGSSPVLEAGIEFSELSAADSEKLIETIDILKRFPRKKIRP